MILAKRERTGEAVTAFQNAIQVDATYGPAYLRLAEALDRIGRPAEAWSAGEQAYDRGEDVAPALWQQLTEKVPSAPPLPPPCADAAGAMIDLDRRIAATSPGSASACRPIWSIRGGPESAGSGASYRWSSGSAGRGASSARRCAAPRARSSSTATC